MTKHIRLQLVDTEGLARRLGVNAHTLYMWRTRGIGPAYIRLTNGPRPVVRYRVAAVNDWLDKRAAAPGGGAR